MKYPLIITAALGMFVVSGIVMFRSFTSPHIPSQETPAGSAVPQASSQLPTPSITEQTPLSSPETPSPTSFPEVSGTPAPSPAITTGGTKAPTPSPTKISTSVPTKTLQPTPTATAAIPTPSPTPTLIPTPTPTQTPAPQATPTRNPKKFFVFIANSHFQPESLEIHVGDTVTWVNKDEDKLHWPASDPHPTHTALSGFDPLGDLSYEESFSYTFTAPGVIPYHDHSAAVIHGVATIKGTVVVRE